MDAIFKFLFILMLMGLGIKSMGDIKDKMISDALKL